MPIAVKDYTWKENNDCIFITVPLKGVLSKKVDILSTEDYVKVSFQLQVTTIWWFTLSTNEEKRSKVSYPPYFFESFLYADVKDEDSSAEIGGGVVLFKLMKVETVQWGQLQKDSAAAGDKEAMKQMRLNAIARHQERTQQNETKRSEKRRQEDKYALKKQMKIEDDDRARIDCVKETERQNATEDLERWKEEQKQFAIVERERMLVENPVDSIVLENVARPESLARKVIQPVLQHQKTEDSTPAVRGAGTIAVSFTHRDFPTAARESTAPEEEEWLKKQAEAKRIGSVQDDDLTDEERNPEWLKDKGKSFFKSGDYLAAINAFSTAIRLSPKMPSLFSNRSACNLKVKNYIRAAEDAAKALELLTPPVPQNASARCKAHVRRGTALCELELYVEGLLDYEAALKLEPNNEELQNDADKIRKIIQSS